MELNVSGAEARANRIWVFINPLKPSVQWSLHLTHTCTHTLSLCSVVTFLHSQSDVLWWHQAEPWDLRLSRCVWVEPKSTPRKNWPKFWQPFKQEPKKLVWLVFGHHPNIYPLLPPPAVTRAFPVLLPLSYHLGIQTYSHKSTQYCGLRWRLQFRREEIMAQGIWSWKVQNINSLDLEICSK